MKTASSWKRLLSAALATAILIGVAPVPASAVDKTAAVSISSSAAESLPDIPSMERSIVQREADSTADIQITDYAGPADTQARLMNGDAVLSDWTALRGGNCTFANVPAGGWYSIQMRSGEDDQTITTVVEKIGVGDVYIVSGQSNSACFGTEKTAAAYDTVSTYHPTEDKWYECADIQPSISEFNCFADRNGGSAWPTLGDALTEELGIPIGFVLTGYGGTAISGYDPLSGRYYSYLTTAMDALRDTGFRAILWHQGESDAIEGTTTAEYAEALNELIAATREYAGFDVPWIVANAAYHPDAAATDANEAAVRAGQQQVCASDGDKTYLGPDTDIMGEAYRDPNDHVHFNKAGLLRHGTMWAAAILDNLEQKAADPTGLQAAVTAVENLVAADYTPATWSVFAAAKTAAEEALNSDTKTNLSLLTAQYVLEDARAQLISANQDNHMKLWYDEPAQDWKTEALPIGNGHIGGMVFGKTDTERVQINEITLWAGGPNSSDAYTGGNTEDAYQYLEQMRAALFAGDYATAETLKHKLVGNGTGWNGYQSLGDFYLDFTGKARTDAPAEYRRELDLEDGVQRVSYINDGITFEREYFTSNPGNVMVVHLTASEADALGFTLSLVPSIASDGYCYPSKTFTTTAEDGVIRCQGEVTSSKMKFAVQMKVVAPDADVTSNPDGTVTVANGEDVLIFMTAGTNYDISEANNIQEISDFHTENGDYLDNDDPNGDVAMAEATERIDAAAAMTYEALLQRHVEDYQSLYERASLDLGDHEYADTPTDELLEHYNNGDTNQYLETLLFQYGRYLLISSSRDAVLPANLQGLWNDNNQAMWCSDYHFDINLQMNYWPAFVTNLADTAEPLVSLIESLQAPGNLTAREHFGIDEGWLVNAQINIFGMTGVGWEFYWGWTPGSGAWICNNLWDYYTYTQNRDILERIYPILKGAAIFWKNCLVEDPNTGELVTAPSASPEHGPVGIGTTYDMALAYMLMEYVIEAGEILGQDADLRAELASMLEKMDPLKIGDSGQIKEWREETAYNTSATGQAISDPAHRHMSHLLSLHPGNLINDTTPELMEAAIRTLQLRGDGTNGSGTGGWSMAQKANLWARTGDGDEALRFLRILFDGGIYSNLFDQVLEVFQIDGNLGAPAAMAEMLLQSHNGAIEPLAALPSDWESGSYRGFVARGNFETDADWSNGQLTRFVIRSGSGLECVVSYPNVSEATVTAGGQPVSFTKIDENTISFATSTGGEYVITNIPAALDAPKDVQALRMDSNQVHVTWQSVEQAASYNVYRYENGVYTLAGSTDTDHFTDSAAPMLDGDGKYMYLVVAVDGSENEGWRPNAVSEVDGTAAIVENTDSRIQYQGSWRNLTGDSRFQNGTASDSWTAGSTATLTFAGTGIELYAAKHVSYDSAIITIDDGNPVQVDLYAASGAPAAEKVWEVTNLPNGIHTIEIRIPSQAESLHQIVYPAANIDYFRILNSEKVYVESITVSSGGVTQLDYPGDSIQMTADVQPTDADSRAIIWSVTRADGSPTNLATIDQNGLLKATQVEGYAVAKVTAAAKDGSGVVGEYWITIATDPWKLSDNLALGSQVTLVGASNYGETYDESKMVDGSYSTRFAAYAPTSDVLEFTFDLGQTQTFNQIVVAERCDKAWADTHGGDGDPRISKLEVWIPDAESDSGWKLIHTAEAPFTDVSNDVELATLNFETVTTDTLLLKATDTSRAGITIWETEIYHVRPEPKPERYTVRFETNGGSSVADLLVLEGELAAEPTAPTRDGYTFAGWFTDTALTAAYRFDTPVRADMTLYAKWTENTSPGGSSTIRYTITVTQATGGKIAPSTTSVTKGSDQTFTITANDGYRIADVLVDGKSVGAVSTYTFKNVTAKHTITAKFEKDGAGIIDHFTDVKTGDWFYDAVAYVVERGLMNGVAPDQFAPQKETTRGMIVTILHREAGSPKVESDGKTWWSDARVWAMRAGISDGTSMDGTLTREQLAAMLYRYVGEPAVSGTITGFSDMNSVSGWASDAMLWAVQNGIITGNNGKLNPQGNATRAEMAAMLMRFMEKMA